jgi:hypothetical protein
MRQLTKKQKRMLTEYLTKHPCVKAIEDIDPEVFEKIDAINPCEIYYQNVNNFIWDYLWAERNKKRI